MDIAPKNSEDCVHGVEEFIDFVRKSSRNLEIIRCPCRMCQNIKILSFEKIHENLFVHGMDVAWKLIDQIY